MDTMLAGDIGIPMIVVEWPLMAAALAPVAAVEGAVVARTLGRGLRAALKDVFLANLWTTLVGVPVAWAFMLALGLVATGGEAWGMETPAHRLAAVTLQAAWLVPYEEHLAWMVPAAAVVLLVPCFALSVFVEDWYLGRRWPDLAPEALSAAVLRANAWSYVLLALAGGAWWAARSA